MGGRVIAVYDDCYEDAWLLRLEASDAAEFAGLLDATAYSELLRTRATER